MAKVASWQVNDDEFSNRRKVSLHHCKEWEREIPGLAQLINRAGFPRPVMIGTSKLALTVSSLWEARESSDDVAITHHSKRFWRG